MKRQLWAFVILAPASCGLAGCGEAQSSRDARPNPTAATPAKPIIKPTAIDDVLAALPSPPEIAETPSELPSAGSQEWWRLVEKNEQRENAEFERNKVQPGETLTAGNLRFEHIRISRDKQWIVSLVDVVNVSENRIVTPFSSIHSATDEFENELRTLRDDIEDDQLKELQPGEKGTVMLAVQSLLKKAKYGTLRIRTQDAKENGKKKTICWRLDFTFPIE